MSNIIVTTTTPKVIVTTSLGASSPAIIAAEEAIIAAAEAAISASNAETAETNAAASALAASNSATAAQTAETNAETAETNAETAETNAAASALAASNSATAASNSATAAQTAETNAETAETNAETAETNAAASALAASNSATAAQTAETNAETAETNSANNVSYTEEWAIKAEDSPVSVAAGGDNSTTFSAYHWAKKAEAFGGGAGTVSSVALSVPTGLSISGSPITTSGTFTVTFTAGYSIPTTAKQTEWDTSYGWGNHASAGYLTSQTSHADVVVDGDFASDGILKRTSAGVYGIVTDNSGNWNTAFGWGNHTSAGYVTAASSNTLTNKTISYADNTLTGVLSIDAAQTFTQKVIKDSAYAYYDSNTTNALNYENGSIQRWAPNTGAQTLSITNWPASGTLGELMLYGVNLGASTITWPTINWVKSDGSFTTTFSLNGVTLQTSGTDFVLLWTSDSGTTIYGKVLR